MPKATQPEVEPGNLTPSPALKGEGDVGEEGLLGTVFSSCVYARGQVFLKPNHPLLCCQPALL